MPYADPKDEIAYQKRRHAKGTGLKIPCGNPICDGVLESYTHDTFPLARCTVCGEDFVIKKHRHSGWWSTLPVKKELTTGGILGGLVAGG